MVRSPIASILLLTIVALVHAIGFDDILIELLILGNDPTANAAHCMKQMLTVSTEIVTILSE